MRNAFRLVVSVSEAAAGSRTLKAVVLGAGLILAFGAGYVGGGAGGNARGWMNVSGLYGDSEENLPLSHISNAEIVSCLAQSMRNLPTDMIRQLDQDDDYVDLSQSGALRRTLQESVGARGC